MTATRMPLAWHKSSYSGNGMNCVEVARTAGAVAVRDAKNPATGMLTFTPTTWRRFLDATTTALATG